jgi:glycosyltransferase involved in cell wall biosynthesis
MSLPLLAFDVDIFQLQRHGGIRLYFTQLNRALFAHHYTRLHLLRPSLPSDVLPLSSDVRVSVLARGIKLLSLLASFASPLLPLLPWQARKIYHASYYRNPLLHWSANPVVVTVHDLIHECFPHYFDPAYSSSIRRYVDAKRRCILAADAIIAVSEATKTDLLRIYPQVDSARVHVIHHGSDHVPAICSHAASDPYPEDVPFSKYLLYVGSRGHYKGFDDLLLAFAELALSSQKLGLVCVGSPFTPEEIDRIQHLSLEGNVICIQADEAHLFRLYQHAFCFVYPSWYEGFGFPILEAMRARCPVVCSDIPSSREIADRHAFFFVAGDSNDLFCQLQLLFALDPVSRGLHLVASQNHASRFTWQATAELTCDLYLSLLDRHVS